ncbi:DNA-3-methyladenine glycosylase family protein [Bordetella pseudohinzii]|uniref:DNA-3-methyladenine glycosylase II n=1 Tax=Bordetella pseudohinzii TaxID=1331258 RepID=A0A0J6BSX8_9BORD|nr:DNA-3-methyladenine glycosylase [Bordetella pseudohinzii]ANY17177.1 DNA-3-methyladenine glycosylase [Bordetella pseudohinzii]KMM24934.1 DNA-3-methyladenine glycosylase [Bordetella pseudohinzii]KXA79117.1 DNA-3-methyladenine glycosylase [Bordetella pseudohinzii]KXA80225.1 DNA-3-methyladenine glycosylase [Bordetella pseudohinzii]CUI98248.1 DNA-3-methyladenine glycosylase [Bordetella pseudohinzii]
MPSSDLESIKPDYWEDAVAHLMRRDRILKKIIPQHSHTWLMSRGTPFVTLARAIVGQQISTKAADGLWTRLLDVAGKRPTPATVLRAGVAGLRAAGLSQRKAEYVQDLADHFGQRKVHPERWATMDDEAVISELVAIRGIGRWTAEMFLIFNLQRPDVLPLDDLGLLKAISLHYFSGEPVSRFEAREVSLAWQPWRTVATWYLWRSLEPTPVQY